MGKKRGLIGLARSILCILTAKPQVAPSVAENETLQVVLRRRSVRNFARREISDEVFAAILEAGRLAPSTVNLQTWSFATFTRDSWREVFERPIPFRARRAVMVMGDQHRARSVLDAFPESPLVGYTVAVMNASLAAMNMTIAAEALGVASVMLSETGRTGLLDGGYLKEKLTQMKAGYKASHPFSSFEAQLRVYESKIGQAEAALRGMILAEQREGERHGG